MSELQRICVFCGSSVGQRDSYARRAKALGREIARRGLELVYGGGNVGLMGAMADTALEAGGTVRGVMPRALVDREIAHGGLTELEVVSDMHERKARMNELSDAFIALPGGWGTLEEIVEVLSWGQLQIHHKPCGFLDVDGFYAALMSFFDYQVSEGFLSSESRHLVASSGEPGELLDLLEAAGRELRPGERRLRGGETDDAGR